MLDAFLWSAENYRETDDGGIELLVDPARVRKTMSENRHSLGGIQKLIRELREVTLEIVVSKTGLSVIGGLVDHVVKSPAIRPDPINGGDRHLWRVRIGLALAELLRNDLPLHYDPSPLARLQNGISQAVARYLLSHTSEPNGGWVLDNAIRAVAGELSDVSMRHRRHEIRLDEDSLAVMGIVIDGERIHRHTAKACSTRPVEPEKAKKRAAPARHRAAPAREDSKTCSTRPVLQDLSGSFQADKKHPPERSASPPSPSAPTPRGDFPAGKEVTSRGGADEDPFVLNESLL
ncbi:hypothetical protein BBC27_11290 [Acidithiobacillus ferrivorans]|uniref:Uncharacterized protein n=1 Tax=Acidithiobacillus ferrivorans TaxID=160808 RepID=A0A1B9BYK1_9PROT|nr:hypothetical protein [Acidithiobacillus ferrivorans]OCB02799.1 hypothetical protein BBC27_11290 [Acidithiobacillus ferrivorans]